MFISCLSAGCFFRSEDSGVFFQPPYHSRIATIGLAVLARRIQFVFFFYLWKAGYFWRKPG